MVLGAGCVLALADPGHAGLALGGPLVSTGAALRVWGAGHLVKTDRLTVTGPYAHLRHPLYAGTLLLGTGFGLVAGPFGAGLVAVGFLPFFFAYYLPYKERIEGARLERRFGPAYVAYRAAVPRLWPARAPFRPAHAAAIAERRWSRARFRENGEAGVLLLVSGLAGWLLAVFACGSR